MKILSFYNKQLFVITMIDCSFACCLGNRIKKIIELFKVFRSTLVDTGQVVRRLIAAVMFEQLYECGLTHVGN